MSKQNQYQIQLSVIKVNCNAGVLLGGIPKQDIAPTADI